MNNKKTKVVHMVTSSQSIGLMKGQLRYLVDSGYEVTVVSSAGPKLIEAIQNEKVNVKAVEMERTIKPIKDLIALLKLIILFLRLKPDICNAGTPKAGLLGMIASKVTGVKFKVYTNRGIAFEGSNGIKRKILKLTEKIACRFADKIICISPSIEKSLIKNHITSKRKTVVFGKGSSNGLQLNKFKKDEKIQREIEEIKNTINLNQFNLIIGYVGRINNFKGVKETVLAFEKLQKKYNNIGLLLIGAKESKDEINNETELKIANNKGIIEIGRVDNPIPYYFIMDVLSFPTYREGFGNVSIEAQATGTPVITTNATGSIDTVIDKKTGFIINIRNVKELEEKLEELLNDKELLNEMGKNARDWVWKNFESQKIWKAISDLYRENI